MADRSFGRITIPRDRAEEAAPILKENGFTCDGFQAFDFEAQGVDWEAEDEAGGGFNAAEDLETAGIPFIHEWDHGIEYDSGAAAFDGVEKVECSADHNGEPLARIEDDGNPNAGDLDAARRYLAVRARVVEIIRRAEETAR